ncbi:uncharacterized protein LAESUDRAFT_17959 [Laetiporus sulphureus 93-53]|uniref:BTB domain-containing protein n=1 Tax=Laetiporus sulphureus 93-53 TaxID=1314785 RepID=A0A165IAZ7_9APHY|nr:uncharacterized protein LAESUDRAFT_17959 [Laetiporus sulphureus 93-53]KZT12827.1 hypothetical protein LAESUDRAFT_17959 [Laetiporus sulphureus 93-53]
MLSASSAPLVKRTIETTHKRHQKFYFKDGNVIFLVEDTFYNVHRYFLERDSKLFQDLFSLPQKQSAEGLSDDNPIRLVCTKSIDMERFLSVLYPRRIGKYDLETTEEWVSVLEFAYKWQFDAVCQLVRERLPEVATLVEQIVLARQYNLPDLLLNARVKICEREEALSLHEGRQLGIDECIVINQVRQEARSNHYATSAMKFDEWDRRMLQKMFQTPDER